MSEPVGEVSKLYQLAVNYRRTVLLLGATWLVASFSSGQSGALSAVAVVVLLGLSVAMAVHGVRLARLLGLFWPPAWGVLFFIPLVSLLALLSLSRRSTAYCRTHGVRVGLLGPRLDDIERLRESGLPRAEAR